MAILLSQIIKDAVNKLAQDWDSYHETYDSINDLIR